MTGICAQEVSAACFRFEFKRVVSLENEQKRCERRLIDGSVIVTASEGPESSPLKEWSIPVLE
jgi:hypothetical protein